MYSTHLKTLQYIRNNAVLRNPGLSEPELSQKWEKKDSK